LVPTKYFGERKFNCCSDCIDIYSDSLTVRESKVNCDLCGHGHFKGRGVYFLGLSFCAECLLWASRKARAKLVNDCL
jgi:late competence protein required for DNA uptake (superfamily II DNA/RNA helicase)